MILEGTITHITGRQLVKAQLDTGNYIAAPVATFEAAVPVGEFTFFGSKVRYPAARNQSILTLYYRLYQNGVEDDLHGWW